MEPNTQETKPEIEKVKGTGLEQFSGSEQATGESSEIAIPNRIEAVAEADSAQTETVGEQAEAVGGLTGEATAQSVGDIIKQGDSAIVKTLPTEEAKREAINDALFESSSEFNPFEATDIANGESISSEQ
jgi:hypothetical protein